MKELIKRILFVFSKEHKKEADYREFMRSQLDRFKSDN